MYPPYPLSYSHPQLTNTSLLAGTCYSPPNLFQFVVGVDFLGIQSLGSGTRPGLVVEALCYKSEGRGFDFRSPGFFHFNLTLTQPLTEMITRNLPVSKARPVHEANNLTSVHDPIV
jgi:hypothetical protein